MSVVGLAHERADRRRATQDAAGMHSYIRVFLVTVDNKHDDANVVLAAPGLPIQYEIYSTNTTTNSKAFCQTRSPQQMSRTWFHWEVTCTYQELPEKEGFLDRRLHFPKMSFIPEKVRAPIVGTPISSRIIPDMDDIYEEPMVNSFGDTFDPQPMATHSRGVLTITRNQSSFSPAIALAYQDAVNADPFFGALPRQMLFVSSACPGREEQNLDGVVILYYPTSYIFKFRREGWDERILDQGAMYYKFNKPKIKKWERRFADPTGFAQPYGLLDGNGYALRDAIGASTSTGISTTSSTFNLFDHAVYIRKRVNVLLPFAPFNLPQVFS
jgi:hypothetical protein